MHRRVNWALMLATLASAFALYAVKYDTRRLEARVQAQERALEKAESDMTVLVAERAHLARPERLEPLARLIGLAPIASTQYLRVEAGGAGEPTREDAPASRQ
jgi:cell division protein FtsL